MSVYIVYGSRYGGSEACARYLGNHLPATLMTAKEALSLQDASCIIVGSSIYAGRLHKDIRKFLKEKEDLLGRNPIYFYLCGLEQMQCEKVMSENVSSMLLEKRQGTYFVGGILNFSKMSFLERKIIAILNKEKHFVDKINKSEVVDLLDYDALNQFVEDVKGRNFE